MNLKFLSFLFFQSSTAPVALVPGFGGSVIYSSDRQVLWPPKVLDLIQYPQYFYNIGCHYQNSEFILNTNTTMGELGNLDGVKIVNKWIAPIVQHGYFDDMIETLYKIYCPDCLYGFPYDFRLIGNRPYRKKFYQEMRRYIEKLRKKHSQKVVLVAHSLGGLLIHDFLSQQSDAWLEKNIGKAIFVSCPWEGTVNALKLLLNEKVYIKNIHREVVLPYLRYYSCLLLLLPSTLQKVIYESNDGQQVTTDNISEYWKDHNVIPHRAHHFDDVIQSLEAKPKVEYHVIFGNGHSTPTKILQDENTLIFDPGDGDGVIEMESLEGFQKWASPCYSHVLSGEEHTKILKSPAFLELLYKLLR